MIEYLKFALRHSKVEKNEQEENWNTIGKIFIINESSDSL